MEFLEALRKKWDGLEKPLLLSDSERVLAKDVLAGSNEVSGRVKGGDVVALIGDFDHKTISNFLALAEVGAIIVPLTEQTHKQHHYFFEQAQVDWILDNSELTPFPKSEKVQQNKLLSNLRELGHAGLILFTSGTTGRPKAILHDLDKFLFRFQTPRPSLRTLSFLLFDHIGGINTLLHTLFNVGTIIATQKRDVLSVINAINDHEIEVLPTTPSFLRLLLLSGVTQEDLPESLKVITYGTERMSESTLEQLAVTFSNVDFRQTYGMSELGILRIKSESRTSLYMRVGGEGVETRIVDGILEIRSQSRMLGYLNAPDPFDEDGWYNTGDRVDQKGDLLKVLGRKDDLINVGGLKVDPSRVEDRANSFVGVKDSKCIPGDNPILGQHVELEVEFVSQDQSGEKISNLRTYLTNELEAHEIPMRIIEKLIPVNHRFKKM